jgi:hypothetical protein
VETGSAAPHGDGFIQIVGSELVSDPEVRTSSMANLTVDPAQAQTDDAAGIRNQAPARQDSLRGLTFVPAPAVLRISIPSQGTD